MIERDAFIIFIVGYLIYFLFRLTLIGDYIHFCVQI